MLSLLGALLLLEEPSALLKVNVEDHAVDDYHLSEELQSVLANISRAVMQPAYHSLKQREVVVPRDHIRLSKLDEDLADLCSAVCTLVMEPSVEKLEEFLLRLVVDGLSVGVTCLSCQHEVDDVCENLDDGLPQ